MGILSRFADIMEADLNALFDSKDKAPDRVLDNYMEDLSSDLKKVRMETATMMAEEQRLKNELNAFKKEIEKLDSYAVRAVAAGKEEDAAQFLREKARMEAMLPGMEENAALASENTQKMRQMYAKLSEDISRLSDQREALKGKFMTAQAMNHVNYIQDDTSDSSMANIHAMEAKADRILAANEAKFEEMERTARINALKNKYDTPGEKDIQEQMQAIKIKLGQENPIDDPDAALADLKNNLPGDEEE